MDRLIEVKVRGNFVSKDNKNAGTQGEYNITTMRIEFDEGWDGYAKHLTFWNAYGENPVKRILTADLLEDITANTRIYAVKIPGEPLAEAGEMSFVIDGYIDGVLQRTVEDRLTVKPANSAEDAGQPADPTPSQAQQLQAEIDAVMVEIQKASTAAASAEAAAKSAEEARVSAGAAATSAAEAKTCEENAAKSVTAAEAAKKAAEAAKTEVENAASEATSSAQAAAQSASAASTSEKNAAASASTAANSIQSANASQQAAAQSASAAASSANAAAQSAAKAGASEKNAAESETAAKQAQAAAEKARDEAQGIVGGDFATRTEAQGYASTAESNANSYTDEKIAAIPAPDVSGQINAHNSAADAHSDIRTLANNAATAAANAQSTANEAKAAAEEAANSASSFELLAEYKTAGSYAFTVPDDVDELGVLVLGGGGSGGFARNYNSSGYAALASGGGSGEIVQAVLSKANGDFSPGAALAVVVGAGGASVTYKASNQDNYRQVGNNGGSSSFGSVVAEGGNGGQLYTLTSTTSDTGGVKGSGGAGQSSDYCNSNASKAKSLDSPAPYGMVSCIENYTTATYGYIYSTIRKSTAMTVNRFDPSDAHIYCGAGGSVYCCTSDARKAQTTVERARGHAGAGAYCSYASDPIAAGNATAPGDGGGGMGNTRAATSNFVTYSSGAGADGLVLVYGRKVK